MKLPILGIFLLFILTGCGKSEKEQLEDELIPVIGSAADEMIRHAELSFNQCNRPEEKNNFKQTSFLKEEGILKVRSAHAITKRFLDYSSKFRQKYQYKENFPIEEVNSRFRVSFDSINQLIEFMPDKNYSPFDYTKSKHKSNLVLTIIRMDYDIAKLEVDVLNDLDLQYSVTVFRDDFRQSIEQK